MYFTNFNHISKDVWFDASIRIWDKTWLKGNLY